MKNQEELLKDIVSITMKIQRDYPELSKYLNETPVKYSKDDDSAIDIKSLEDYYKSLCELILEYSSEHSKNDQPEKE
jgi:hypothetical protein